MVAIKSPLHSIMAAGSQLGALGLQQWLGWRCELHISTPWGGGNDIVTTGRHRGTRCSSCKGLWGLGVCTEHLQSVSSIGTLLSSSLFSITHPEQ